MHKNYVRAAAIAGLLSLAACTGKPANEQAAEDAQKINLDAAIPKMAASLALECARGGIKTGCPADKARGFLKAYPAVAQAVAEYDKKCPGTYGAKMCAEGYSGFLAENIVNKLASPVAARAKEILQARAEAERRAAAERANAARKIAEEAARKAKAAAEEAARKAEEEAKAAAEEVKAKRDSAADKAADKTADKAKAALGAAHSPASPAPHTAPAGAAHKPAAPVPHGAGEAH